MDNLSLSEKGVQNGKKKIISNRISSANGRAGLTQEQVAEKMGTKATAITRLESANSRHSPKVETLRKYAEAVGCQLNIELIPD